MLSIKQLPQIATSIKRKSFNPDQYGIDGNYSVIYTNIHCRLVNNVVVVNPLQSEGKMDKSTHLCFMNFLEGLVTLNIQVSDLLIINSEEYIVDYVDKSPGGVDNHHMQIFCSHRV